MMDASLMDVTNMTHQLDTKVADFAENVDAMFLIFNAIVVSRKSNTITVLRNFNCKFIFKRCVCLVILLISRA